MSRNRVLWYNTGLNLGLLLKSVVYVDSYRCNIYLQKCHQSVHFEKLVVFEIECDAGGRIFCWASSWWKHSSLKHPALKFHLLGNKQPVQRIQPLLFLDEKKKGSYSIVTKFKQARCNLPKNAVAVLNTVQFRHRVG